MDQQLVDSIKEELVMLSLIDVVNVVEVDHDETSCHIYINNVPFFSLYFLKKHREYFLIPSSNLVIQDTSEAVLLVIKRLVEGKIKGEV